MIIPIYKHLITCDHDGCKVKSYFDSPQLNSYKAFLEYEFAYWNYDAGKYYCQNHKVVKCATPG